MKGDPIVKRSLCLALAGLLLGASWLAAADKNPVVVMDTSLGTIKVELYPDKAPVTVKNFLDYVDGKFYDGTLVHRVVPKFVIQGGGLEPGLKEKKTREAIKNEANNGLSNEQYTIAMAREPDPDTATAQFYINLVDNGHKLDRVPDNPKKAGYCVFGKVIEGKDVVDKIAAVETENRGDYENVPVKDVVIKSIRRAEK
jgi:cyclophilin family peptidyl-prolyl cis-trans isomerase